MTDSPPAVRVENLTKIFPLPLRRGKGLVAVNNISFEIAPGEVYGLIGPNGSGKSTTMKVLLGLIKATSGTTEIFGKDSSEVASRGDVGFLPENPYFYKHLTAAETLRFYGKLCGMSGAEIASRTDELLELVGLTAARDRRLGGYSKGMLQRIGLAAALVQSPRLVLLDEPTAGVDPAGSRKIRDLIFRLKEEGISVILSSHLLEQVQEVCDHIGIIFNGRMVRAGRLEELISIEDQTEVLLENASPELLEEIRKLATRENAELLRIGNPRTTLERFFLEATTGSEEGVGRGATESEIEEANQQAAGEDAR